MKKNLLFLLLVCALCSKAQNVIIKDSSFTLYNGSTEGLPPTVASYSYNNECHVSSKKNIYSQWLYSYYQNGNLYQQTNQSFDQATNTYINFRRSTYVYTSSNKLSSLLVERWNATSGLYINESKDSTVYDEHDYTIKYLSYTWDTLTKTWINTTQRVYYNDNNGLADSVISYNYDVKETTKDYYTYNTASAKPVTSSSDYYDSTNTIYLSYRYSYFYDSANSIRTDSTYSERKYFSDTGFIPAAKYVTKLTYNTDGTVKESEITTMLLVDAPFNYIDKIFYFYIPCSIALPATLLNFSGEQKNDNAFLHWQTANEVNTYHFNIQRSTDGMNFTTIGKVKASGNSSVRKDYTYTDADIKGLNTKKLYYRLAVTSNDGSITYSKIVPINVFADKYYISVSPNPFTSSIAVNIPVAIQDAKITISDISGKVLYTAAQSSLSGKFTIDGSRFAKGMYIITIQSATDKSIFKILK